MKKVKGFFIPLGIFIAALSYYFFIEGWGCKLYQRFDFDSQAFLFWQYAASQKIIPYKDVFYPYGILFFLKDQSFFWQCIFYGIPSLLFSVSFNTFFKIYKNTVLTLVCTFCFFLFTIQFNGTETIARYGVVVIAILVFAQIFSKKYLPSTRILLGLGISCGVIFSLLTDQGMYIFVLSILFLVINPLIQGKKGLMHIYRQIFFKIILFIGACFLGVIPYALYLFSQDNLVSFLKALSENSDIVLYAKTPFTPYAASPENIFTFIILFITIGFLLVRRVIYKTEFSYINYLQLYFVLVLILLEQKSMIRSIAGQLTFISLFLYIFLFNYLRKVSVFGSYMPVFSFFGLYMLASIIVLEPFQKRYISTNYLDPKRCVDANALLAMKKYPAMKNVVSYLQKNLHKGESIFSYHGDPIFYLLLSRPIPYYPSGYESSPLYAQERQIQYLKEKHVRYIIYNLQSFSIQDDVPDYVRNPLVLKYIFTHFTPITKINNFLVLEKKDNGDIFSTTEAMSKELTEYLLSVSLGNIPRSEARYKNMFIPSKNGKAITVKRNIHFHESSVDLFLTVKTTNTNDSFVSISTEDNKKTHIHMKNCFTSCIIRLERVPLFYKHRIINQIESSDKDAKMTIFRTKNTQFW